jgi:hypothetical protein
MLPDGWLFPGVEMADAESLRMTLLNIITWFRNRPYPSGPGGVGKLLIIYDDMCHLLR